MELLSRVICARPFAHDPLCAAGLQIGLDDKAAGWKRDRPAIGREGSRPHRRLRQRPTIASAAGTNQPAARQRACTRGRGVRLE